MNAPRSGGMGVAQILRIVAFLAVMVVVGWLVYTIRGTLLPFIIAFVISYLLMPLVDYFESHRVNRMAAAAGVMTVVFAIVIVPLVFIIPILVNGAQDLIQRMVGERGTWSCVVENRGATPVVIDRFESDVGDFAIERLPLDLKPNTRDTLLVTFAPEVREPRFAALGIFGQGGGVDGALRMHLEGNHPTALADSTVGRPLHAVAFGAAQLALSDTTHIFGVYQPSYLALIKAYNRDFVAYLETSLPMLKGMNLADQINRRMQTIATDMLKETPEIARQLLSGLTFVIIVPLVLFFFLGEGRTIKRALIELVPNQYFEMVLNLLYRIDVQLGGYIRGMVLSVIIISLLSVTGLYIIGLDSYLVIGTVAGLANVIPYLGPLIGIVAGVIAAALQYSALTWGVILPVIIVFMIVQVMDNVFVAPVVVARSVNLHPLVVIFVVLVGSQLFGAVGMLLAVPATAVLKVSIQTVYEGLRSYSV